MSRLLDYQAASVYRALDTAQVTFRQSQAHAAVRDEDVLLRHRVQALDWLDMRHSTRVHTEEFARRRCYACAQDQN